ncbi:hypothetical protein XH80_15365 [Bradyrhizobium sp. CCBAU 45384]|nr:hypothetical protein [Bradyrhizobium sp. CCBAU 45384]
MQKFEASTRCLRHRSAAAVADLEVSEAIEFGAPTYMGASADALDQSGAPVCQRLLEGIG